MPSSVEVTWLAREHEFLLRALREVVNGVTAPCHTVFMGNASAPLLSYMSSSAFSLIGLRYTFDLLSLIFDEFQPILPSIFFQDRVEIPW